MKKSKCLIGIIIFVIAVSVVYRAYVVPNVLYPVRYDEYVEKYAADYNIDKKLVFAVIKAESGFDKNDRSKTGARGLRAIMESVMMDAMFEVPSDDNVKECIITKESVDGEEQPKLITHDDEVKMLPKKKGKKESDKKDEIA